MEYNPGKESFSKRTPQPEIQKHIQNEIEEYVYLKEDLLEEDNGETHENHSHKERFFYANNLLALDGQVVRSLESTFDIKIKNEDIESFFKNEKVKKDIGENAQKQILEYLSIANSKPIYIHYTEKDNTEMTPEETKEWVVYRTEKYSSEKLILAGIEVFSDEKGDTHYNGIAYIDKDPETESIFPIVTLNSNGNRRTHTIDLNKKFTKEELKNKARRRAQQLIKLGSLNKLRAIRRALEEIMPPDKYEQFSKVALLIGEKYGISKFTNENLQFSTNQIGWHSWYLKIPDSSYNIELNDEDNQSIISNKYMAIKITDHLTQKAQHFTREGFPIDETYIIDEENITVLKNKNLWVDEDWDSEHDNYNWIQGENETVSFEKIEEYFKNKI